MDDKKVGKKIYNLLGSAFSLFFKQYTYLMIFSTFTKP